ncbi:bacterioferritin-associated ferredoxin [Methylococcus sp. EFPC2]|uniref:(2Fe-2S)-binding protein n=1 Tax=Methylococcus sp. EFPC2 TaxID=2812648 RepID=UPI001967A83A|nr:(2Fe-2S)-binding protein [Methylococcus sp. EFPC2]QSA99220.1 (2Fe-2S)-binding protein [Methylococcus sp. EFPC2]
MYVCICKGVTENQIREAIQGGLCTRKDISRCLKVGTACGKCNQEVRDLLQQTLPAGGPMARSNGEAARVFKMPGRLCLSNEAVARIAESAVCPA